VFAVINPLIQLKKSQLTIRIKSMKSMLLFILTALATGDFAYQARAISITLQPASQTIGVGGSTTLDLVISDLGNPGSSSLGGFDFDLTYNASVLSANSVVFGTFLNTASGFGFFTIDNTLGLLHLDEISLETAAYLNANQPDSFTLATLNFGGLASGSSVVDFSYAALSDEDANSLADFTTAGASITVNGAASVPDSGSMCSLLAVACATLISFRKVAALGNT
jgi:hypothetical protein